MSTEKITTEKKVRVARNSESILQGALKLSLQERVNLCTAVKISIQKEIEELNQQSSIANELLKGL